MALSFLRTKHHGQTRASPDRPQTQLETHGWQPMCLLATLNTHFPFLHSAGPVAVVVRCCCEYVALSLNGYGTGHVIWRSSIGLAGCFIKVRRSKYARIGFPGRRSGVVLLWPLTKPIRRVGGATEHKTAACRADEPRMTAGRPAWRKREMRTMCDQVPGKGEGVGEDEDEGEGEVEGQSFLCGAQVQVRQGVDEAGQGLGRDR